MARHLFLTGSSGEGKTTLLLCALRPYLGMGGGFLSQRLTGDDGQTVGFRLASLEEIQVSGAAVSRHYEAGLPGIFLDCLEGEGKVRPGVFDDIGVGLLNSGRTKRFLYLDEIGGTDLVEPRYREALRSVLRSGPPCIGVLKSRDNFISMGSRVSIGMEVRDFRDELERDIRDRYDGWIFRYSREREGKTKEAVLRFLKRNCRTGGGIT